MPDMIKLSQNKERIISIIRESGPTLPTRVARQTNIQPLFISAFLAELVSDRKLKISNMKVGSSPLYFIAGQEASLENFIEHLNPKEKEAFYLLKDSQILQDENLAPAIRVALRSIKDFAVPVNARINGERKLFWRHFQLPDSEIKRKIQELLSEKKPKPKSREIPVPSPALGKEEKPEILEKSKSEPKKQKTQISEFANSIRDYLSSKDIEILESLNVKKREFTARIRIDNLFGKQEFYLIAKDKKSITDNDITIAHQHAQAKKMPALILSPGNLNKKAVIHLQEWKNLVKFEKVNI